MSEPQHADAIIDGTYRIKWGKKWLPVAIWTRDGVRNFRKGYDSISDEFEQHELFLQCKPFDKSAVKYAFENNMEWPSDAIGFDVDTSSDATPAPPPEAVAPPPTAVKGNATARAELLGMIAAVDAWATNKPDEIDKALADEAANNDDRLIQLKAAVEKERDDALAKLKDTENQRDQEKKAADQALKIARTNHTNAVAARKAGAEDWKSILNRIGPARDACKSVYVSWQRARSLESDNPKDWQVGGQFGSNKGYLRKHDPLHPINIAAAKAAEEIAERLELERQLEAKRQAELKAAQDAAAEAARAKESDRLAIKLAADRAAAASAVATATPPAGHNLPPKDKVDDALSLLDEMVPATAPVGPVIGAEITDWNAAVLHYIDHPTIRDAIRTLATKDLQAGRDGVAAFANAVHGLEAAE